MALLVYCDQLPSVPILDFCEIIQNQFLLNDFYLFSDSMSVLFVTTLTRYDFIGAILDDEAFIPGNLT